MSEEILGFFHVILVSALFIFIATAYLQSKLTLTYKLTINLVTLRAACLFIHVNRSAETGHIDFL